MDLSAVAMQRLPSGRHELSREDVFASQRGRLLLAMISVVGERGWNATRLSDVVAKAGVSRQAFYQHFENKDACFIEAFRVGIPELFKPIDATAADLPDEDWQDMVAAFWHAYVQTLTDMPGLARALHVEMLRASDQVAELRAELFALLAERMRLVYERGRRQDPTLPELPRELHALIIGGLDELVRERLRTLDTEIALDGLAPLAARMNIVALTAGRSG